MLFCVDLLHEEPLLHSAECAKTVRGPQTQVVERVVGPLVELIEVREPHQGGGHCAASSLKPNSLSVF